MDGSTLAHYHPPLPRCLRPVGPPNFLCHRQKRKVLSFESKVFKMTKQKLLQDSDFHKYMTSKTVFWYGSWPSVGDRQIAMEKGKVDWNTILSTKAILILTRKCLGWDLNGSKKGEPARRYFQSLLVEKNLWMICHKLECFAAAEKEGAGSDKTCSDPLTLSHLQAIHPHSFNTSSLSALLVAQFKGWRKRNRGG